MSFILRSVRPSSIQAWIAVNAPASIRATGRESWRAFLVANGGVGQSFRDLEMTYLAAQGRTGATLHDRWAAHLSATGGAGGPEKARNLYK